MNLCVLCLFFSVVSSVRCSLKYLITTTSGIPEFPVVVDTATVDGVLLVHCDSDIKRAEPKQDWMRQLFKDDPDHLQWYSQKCLGNLQVFRGSIHMLKKDLNQTEGPHILQRVIDCEWDSVTEEINVSIRYGFDGEDLMAFEMQEARWMAPEAQAVSVKLTWLSDRARVEYDRNHDACRDRLKKYLNYGRSFLQRTELPSLFLLQKTPSSPVSCHATGFYPERAELFWRRDGKKVTERVYEGEILPNSDGTFQMSAEVNISSIKLEDWRRYDCVFQLSGVKDDIVTRLEEAVILTNGVSSLVHLVVLLLLILAVIGVLTFMIFRGCQAEPHEERQNRDASIPRPQPDQLTCSPETTTVAFCPRESRLFSKISKVFYI